MTPANWHEKSIAKRHNRKGFRLRPTNLNTFLAKHARQAHESSASKTYVAIDNPGSVTVLGFYTLSPAQVNFNLVPETPQPTRGRQASNRWFSPRQAGGRARLCKGRGSAASC